jgi:6,7-dimethyl-8-ribityllumazine synthase
MANLNVIEGGLVATGGQRFAIVAARFNSLVVDRLVDGAVDALEALCHAGAAAGPDEHRGANACAWH